MYEVHFHTFGCVKENIADKDNNIHSVPFIVTDMFVMQSVSLSVQNTLRRLFDVQQQNCKYSRCYSAGKSERLGLWRCEICQTPMTFLLDMESKPQTVSGKVVRDSEAGEKMRQSFSAQFEVLKSGGQMDGHWRNRQIIMMEIMGKWLR